jgi:hypothetical protein|tara:strand:+ start:2932 stop:4155 length:1224 start_codon:yes stop_codon:yes gene_type:complete
VGFSGLSKFSLKVLLAAFLFTLALNASTSGSFKVTTVPPEIRRDMNLSGFYQKCVIIRGFSIVGSPKVSDFALKEAAYLIDKMTIKHPEYLQKLAENKVRFSIMARDEFTTDIPEHSDMSPAIFWDKRARGLGATPARPAVSCGEENLLAIEGDPYKRENILIHEFAHALHAMAINDLDPTFQSRLEKCFKLAIEEKIWEGTYAASNPAEYFAEGVQSWYECNRANDREHGSIDTRKEVQKYDPRLANLIIEKFGEDSWKYIHVSERISKGKHLKGFNPEKEDPFVWPARLTDWHNKFQQGKVSLAPEGAEAVIPVKQGKGIKSEYSRRRCEFFFHNLSGHTIQMHWIDFNGKMSQSRNLRHKDHTRIQSFTGHCWRIKSLNENSASKTKFYRLPDAKHANLSLLKL